MQRDGFWVAWLTRKTRREKEGRKPRLSRVKMRTLSVKRGEEGTLAISFPSFEDELEGCLLTPAGRVFPPARRTRSSVVRSLVLACCASSEMAGRRATREAM